ncbi:hypothetical protein [Oharaeibacter diazotrophicus]|uniref:hypothetical protein n=1 Tax=Oharaeibacter diazotrophicus TaxID=1920512 RepID=UPI000F8436F4|nr:hypothetical protein [Oharaeibacter diazotrophicus]
MSTRALASSRDRPRVGGTTGRGNATLGRGREGPDGGAPPIDLARVLVETIGRRRPFGDVRLDAAAIARAGGVQQTLIEGALRRLALLGFVRPTGHGCYVAAMLTARRTREEFAVWADGGETPAPASAAALCRLALEAGTAALGMAGLPDDPVALARLRDVEAARRSGEPLLAAALEARHRRLLETEFVARLKLAHALPFAGLSPASVRSSELPNAPGTSA